MVDKSTIMYCSFPCKHLFYVGKEAHSFYPARKWKHIHAAHLFNLISALLKRHQISGQAGRFAADINHPIYPKFNDLSNSLWVNAIPWRIQDNNIRAVGKFINNL